MFFLWFFGVGIVDGFRPASRLVFHSVSRSVPRLVLRSVLRPASSLVSPFGSFPRFVPRFAFRSALLFVSPFGRVGWAVCWSRRFCQLVWGWQAFISLSCFGAVGAMCRHVVSLMGAVRKMAW